MPRVVNKLPDNLDIEQVMEAVKESWSSCSNPGFCMACGAERGGCEPDAENYECWECGENMVFGAEQVLLIYA
jgi:hypothetical protein